MSSRDSVTSRGGSGVGQPTSNGARSRMKVTLGGKTWDLAPLPWRVVKSLQPKLLGLWATLAELGSANVIKVGEADLDRLADCVYAATQHAAEGDKLSARSSSTSCRSPRKRWSPPSRRWRSPSACARPPRKRRRIRREKHRLAGADRLRLRLDRLDGRRGPRPDDLSAVRGLPGRVALAAAGPLARRRLHGLQAAEGRRAEGGERAPEGGGGGRSLARDFPGGVIR